MALVLPLALGLAVALIAGGDLRRLGDIRIRGMWLFYGALGLQVAAFPFGPLPWDVPDGAAVALWLASYALLLTAAGLNVRVPGVAIVLGGMACNVAAVLANGGHMPVRPQAMRDAGYDYVVHQNSAVVSHPHLSFLIDRWAAPSWIPGANVFSVGDVAIAVGAFAFALLATGACARWTRGSMRSARA
jgi:hypothetical protein